MKTTITIILIGLFSLSLYGQEQSQKKEFNDNGSISFMSFASQKAKRSLQDIEGIFKDSLGLGKGNSLRLTRTENDNIGFSHLYYDQFYNGIKVEYGMYSVHLKGGQIEYLTGKHQIFKNVSTEASLSEADALKSALKLIRASKYMWEDINEEKMLKSINASDRSTYFPKGELVIMKNIFGGTETYHLAYKFDIFAKTPFSHKIYYIDAKNGSLLYSEELIKHHNITSGKHGGENHDKFEKTRLFANTIISQYYIFANTPASGDTRYSGNQNFTSDSFTGGFRLQETRNGVWIQTLNMLGQGSNYAGAPDFSDSDNNWTAAEYNNSNRDNAALDAHWATEKVYDYFNSSHGRNSWNNQGGSLLNYIHADLRSFGQSNNDNAFWDGQRMTYGDGENSFSPLTSLDIVAHEIGHGVMQTSANLTYAGESGALNEGFSDIWAACVVGTYAPTKQRWLIGNEVSLFGIPLRSMSNPNSGLSAQPDTYGGTYWYSTAGCTPNSNNDRCGVHTNSGVLNYWFYLLTEGGSGTNDIGNAFSLTGIGLNDAGRIAYRTISVILTNPQATYSVARSATIQAAIDIFGAGSCQEIATTAAWYAVGIGTNYASSATITGPASFCSTQSYSTGDASTVWSVTNIAGGGCNLSTTTGGSTTLSFTAPGKSILHANKTVCGVTVSSSKEIYYGAPVKALLSVRGTSSIGNPNQPGDYGVRYDGQNVCGASNKASLTNIQWEVSPSASSMQEGSMACAMDFPFGAGQTIRFGSTGTKYIRVRAQNACGWSDWTDWASFTVNVSGSGRFSYYPNPTDAVLNVGYENNSDVSLQKGSSETQPFSVKLYDSFGKVILNNRSNDGRTIQLGVQHLTNGTYYLHIISNGNTEKKQVVINR